MGMQWDNVFSESIKTINYIACVSALDRGRRVGFGTLKNALHFMRLNRDCYKIINAQGKIVYTRQGNKIIKQ